MKTKLWKLFVLIAAAALLSLAWLTSVQAADEMRVVYVSVPAGWDTPHIWAWDDAGNNAFSAWPGGALEADPVNPGWLFAHLPAGMTNIIINADGGLQTDDHPIESLPVWITVLSEDEVEISYEALTVGVPPAYVPRFTVYARVPAGWDTVNLWAWMHPEGTNAFSAWPGAQMRRVGDWHSARVPYWVNSIIINGNDGTVQTTDLTVESQTLWVLVSDDLTAAVFYENPDFMVQNITVRARVPDGWDTPHLWAWLHPEGTNVFAAWPGEPMVRVGDWYTLEIPGWVNSLIVNANAGTIQTGNIQEVEIGRDVWILVYDAETYGHAYREIANMSETIVLGQDAENDPPPAAPAAGAVPDAPADDESGMATWLIIVIIAAAVIIIGGVVIIIRKR